MDLLSVPDMRDSTTYQTITQNLCRIIDQGLYGMYKIADFILPTSLQHTTLL